MSTKTTNLNLIKPAQNDFYNVDDFNNNMDKIDEAIVGKSDTSHTHNYAGSTIAGGAADYANHLNVNDIAENTDLNDITEFGFHRCGQTAIARTLTNCPTSTAFFMIVGWAAYPCQEIITYGTEQKRYMRNCVGGDNWSDWVEVSLDGHTHSTSDLEAGTFSGQMKANSDAATNVGAYQIRNIAADTVDLTPGVSSLVTGQICIIYE